MKLPGLRKHQRGAVLYIALALLVVLALGALFAVQTALSEQRSATSDMRAKISQQVAESGLDQAVEYIRLNFETLLPSPGSLPAGDWTACAADDASFPCGSIEPGAASSANRALYYAYTGGSDIADNAAAAEVDERSLPLDNAFDQVGGFDVTYNVGAVICPVEFDTIGTGSTSCTSDAEKSETFALTLVSTGQIDGESARSTVSLGLSQYRVISPNPNVPPVVSQSVISGLGNATIVSNPDGNSMGNLTGSQGGWPISAWSRGDISSSGSWQTCEASDYFDSSTTLEANNIRVCDDCTCKTTVSSNGLEGKDILDRNGGDSGVLKPTDSALAPNYYFPCDLFAFTFGVAAREDKETTDTEKDIPVLCETQLDTDLSTEDTTDIEDFLADNFVRIQTDKGKQACQDELVDKSEEGGLFWFPDGCTFTSGSQVGSPEHPVVIVADSTFSVRGPTVYGIVFVRDPAPKYVSNGAATYDAGGGNGIIYGALVIEGETKINGGLKVISSPGVFQAIANSNENIRFARVPGSWNDRLTY